MFRFGKTKMAVFCILAIFGLFLVLRPVFAATDINQQILDLRKQIDDLTKQADQYKKNADQKHKEANTLANQISILNNQILKLETNIAITSKQIDSSKLQISDLELKIFDAQGKIIQNKAIIAKLITLIYERDKLSLTSIFLKNPRLSDFASQIQSENNLNKKLNELLITVKQQEEELQVTKSDLEDKKKTLETLNSQQTVQKNSVEDTKTSKDKLLVVTKGKEKEYQGLLTQAETKKAQFFTELQKLEADALKTGAFIIHVTADRVPAKGVKIFQWPENDYYVTQGYGMTAYAKRGAYGGASHNGVDIAGGAGTAIKAVAKGTILASGFNNGWGNWVAIRHENLGNLVSLYGHMRAPSGLTNGTSVTTDSIIGYEGATGNATGSHLHLSVYRDFFTYINAKNGQLYFNYFEGSLNPLDYL